jgi:hypothetical protein
VKRLMLVMLSFVVFSTFNVTPNAEAKKVDEFTQEQLIDRYNQIHSILQQFHEGKITETQKDTLLDEIKVKKIVGKSKQNNKESSTIGLFSVPDFAIDLPKPFAYYDSTTGYYYADAFFFWNANTYWEGDFPSTGSWTPYIGYNIGGNDGFGLVFSRPINRVTQSFDVYSDLGNRTSYATPSSASSYGVGYTKQDTGWVESNRTKHYDWNHGYLGVYFTAQQPGQQMSIWQEMAHTWSSTSVTINGISYVGVSWNYNVSENKWTAVAPEAFLFTP